jgi:conjugative relaxase-like TrwC/TraI family protein
MTTTNFFISYTRADSVLAQWIAWQLEAAGYTTLIQAWDSRPGMNFLAWMNEAATDHEQYLSGHGESPGRWYGAGAATLGLQGEAFVAGFQAMFEGRNPTTGELLGRPHGRNAVPAFDVVLRPTKSVSVLYGLGDAVTGRAVLAAHHAGVREAVAYLDGHLGTRRGHGGVQHVFGQGLLAVGFDHRTSREGDPLLHTHLVVANRVQGPDGRWTALDGRDLYRHRLAADAIYRASYQRELVRTLGVQWTPADAHGNRELQVCPRSSSGCCPRPGSSAEVSAGCRRPGLG